MNLDLERILEEHGVAFQRLRKAEKVKILMKWTRSFPELLASARHQEHSESVVRDNEADERYEHLPSCDFFILPDDGSGMPSVECFAAKPPGLRDLVSDMFTKCDELVLLDRGFSWSVVFVNHGPSMPGRYFSFEVDIE